MFLIGCFYLKIDSILFLANFKNVFKLGHESERMPMTFILIKEEEEV